MRPEALIDFTRERFAAGAEDMVVEPVEKGGSDRKFHRLRFGGRAVMVVHYSNGKRENARYVDIARFLASSGVNVPEIHHHDPARGLIWMRDLGGIDLWSARGEPWGRRGPRYEATLRQAHRIHRAATLRYAESGPELEREFDEALYLWEQDYFFEHCLGGALALDSARWKPFVRSPALLALAADLSDRPRCLVHRDFQSQNVLWFEGDAWLIDFQGLRRGLPQYDLASLLYDPYAPLTTDQRNRLLGYYKALAAAEGPVEADFDRVFRACAVQRLMQALGAYGYLGLRAGKPAFLEHIPTAWKSLREVASGLDGLDPFCKLLDSVQP